MKRRRKLRSTASKMADKKPTPDTSEPKGSVMALASALRASTNDMSDTKREDSLRHGMRLIYGGDTRTKAKARGR